MVPTPRLAFSCAVAVSLVSPSLQSSYLHALITPLVDAAVLRKGVLLQAFDVVQVPRLVAVLGRDHADRFIDAGAAAAALEVMSSRGPLPLVVEVVARLVLVGIPLGSMLNHHSSYW